MINVIAETCLDYTVENALNYNIHASIFKELLKVEFKHFLYDLTKELGFVFCHLEVIEPITTTYNSLLQIKVLYTFYTLKNLLSML